MKKKDDGSMDSWDKGTLPASATINRSIDNGYQFMVDNISLSKNQTISFGYSLTYRAPKLVNIELDELNTDTYTDIKSYSTDSCQNGYRSFISDKGKNFPENYVDLSKQVADQQKAAEDSVKNALTDVQSKINAASNSANADVAGMPGMSQLLENRDNGNSLIQNGNLNIDINNEKLNDATKNIEKQVNTAIKGLCEGFKIGKG